MIRRAVLPHAANARSGVMWLTDHRDLPVSGMKDWSLLQLDTSGYIIVSYIKINK